MTTFALHRPIFSVAIIDHSEISGLGLHLYIICRPQAAAAFLSPSSLSNSIILHLLKRLASVIHFLADYYFIRLYVEAKTSSINCLLASLSPQVTIRTRVGGDSVRVQLSLESATELNVVVTPGYSVSVYSPSD